MNIHLEQVILWFCFFTGDSRRPFKVGDAAKYVEAHAPVLPLGKLSKCKPYDSSARGVIYLKVRKKHLLIARKI